MMTKGAGQPPDALQHLQKLMTIVPTPKEEEEEDIRNHR